MEIMITKGESRHTLTCKRVDGSLTRASLNSDIPNHDIAHYVVEKRFNMENGFYGNIKSGMTIDELSDKEIIKGLKPEALLSEIMSRTLQSIGSGAANIDQFTELVNWEAEYIEGIRVPDITLDDITQMKSEFDELCTAWDSMHQDEVLILLFK